MKYKKMVEGKSLGYKKIEYEVTLMNSGFKLIGLNPIVKDNKIIIPTGYVVYEKVGVDER